MKPLAASPRQVLLFSGHRVDAPDRPAPRLPPALLPRAAAAIGAVLDGLGADARDLGLSQAASGGDLLFSEACVARGVRLCWLLPLPEPAFMAASVGGSAGGADWLARYAALRPRLAEPPRLLVPAPHGTSAQVFERGNRWLLDTALAFGVERLCFVCLWDGGPGDGPGGTAQMVREVQRRGARIHRIDPRELAAQPTGDAPTN
jgi:hypothetical protein